MNTCLLDREIPVISVIVPCYNEEESIHACNDRLSAVLRELGEPFEIIYIDDGSKDRTASMLMDIAAEHIHCVVLRLSRNFGHQTAVSAGLEASRGQAVIIIDADLQDPPELIPDMVALWRRGYEVVYGVRSMRSGETAFKLWTAKMFYRTLNWFSDVAIPIDTGDFRLLDKCVVDAFRKMPERHRFLRGMSSWIGFRQTGLNYRREDRYAGKTKYPLKKMLGLAADGIVSFSITPLRLVTLIGFLSAGLAFFGIIYSFGVRIFTHSWVRGWAMSFIGMLFMSGVQMLSLGVVGEYVGRIYTESKQRPLYFLQTSRQNEVYLDKSETQEQIAVPQSKSFK